MILSKYQHGILTQKVHYPAKLPFPIHSTWLLLLDKTMPYFNDQCVILLQYADVGSDYFSCSTN